MDRTVRMMRRTLLCAAFACPLALFSLWLPALILFFTTLCSAVSMPAALPLWRHRHENPGHILLRFLLPCTAGLFISAASSLLARSLFVSSFPFMHGLIRLLSCLTGAAAQCALIARLPYYRRQYLPAVLLFAIGFIVCMLSGA